MKRNKALQTAVYKTLYVAAYVLSLLPIKVLYKVGSVIFFLVYFLAGYRKEIVIQNIARAFPDKKYGEIKAISKKFYVCFAAYFIEIIKSISVKPDVLDNKITFQNLELMNKYINAGLNVIACSGHCGNWEMLNFMSYKIKNNIYAVYKPLRSEQLNRLMTKIRSRFGIKLISNKSVVRHILAKISTPSVYLFLTDQCPNILDEKYKFRLLNQETYVFSGMEKLARASNAAVIYLHITQISKGNYEITCIPICSEAKKTREREITQKYINLLTENIKEEPYGWLWTHKRWKR